MVLNNRDATGKVLTLLISIFPLTLLQEGIILYPTFWNGVFIWDTWL